MGEKKNELPSKEEVKKKAGLAWTMLKGIFRLIIPKKLTKWRLIVAISALIVIVYVINLVIKFVLDIAIYIAIFILIIAGFYMLFTGKLPIGKNKD